MDTCINTFELENINIECFKELISPIDLKKNMVITKKIQNLVFNTRNEIADILSNKSNKKLLIIGPCSIHNIEEAKEYGVLLKNLYDKVKDKIVIVMRVYFEKPRTTIGWKGLINDPDLNETYNVNKGLNKARELLIYLNNLGLPCGYGILDTITPQYISDLISWGAIGARTTESQVHRQIVSGLSMPVGFKNGTDGNIKIAGCAIKSAKYQHCFMGINNEGHPSICKTKGNKNCHVILRGSNKAPNYYKDCVEETQKELKEMDISVNIMIDCSHGNSEKDFRKQRNVADNVIQQMSENKSIIGFMLESNLNEGSQKLTKDNYNKLEKGVSITDSCICFKETELIVLDLYKKL